MNFYHMRLSIKFGWNKFGEFANVSHHQSFPPYGMWPAHAWSLKNSGKAEVMVSENRFLKCSTGWLNFHALLYIHEMYLCCGDNM